MKAKKVRVFLVSSPIISIVWRAGLVPNKGFPERLSDLAGQVTSAHDEDYVQ